MKITSGRIQRAGINPNNGMTLGFRGLGQTSPYVTTDASGLPVAGSSIQSIMALSTIPSGPNATGSDYIDSSGNLISGATGLVIQSAIPPGSAVSPSPMTQATILGIPTNTMILILMGVLGAMILLPPIQGRRR